MNKRKRGFTLIEMSIVIIIIGLIIGGVVISKNMIQNAKLQSVLSDAEAYETAAQLFKKKYKALPGDISNAQNFWGSASSCPIAATNTPTKPTCNGNGDEFIGGSNGTLDVIGDGGASRHLEQMLAWQHLGNAELIQGKYTGAEAIAPYSNKLEPGVNIPASKVRGNGFTMFYVRPTSGAANYNDANYRHILFFGAQKPSASLQGSTHWLGITGEEALQLDIKADDGRPHTGKIQTLTDDFGGTGDTDTCALANDGGYNINSEACALIFITGF